MNINFCSFSGYAVSLMKESVLPSFTAQQKKILVIASIAFAILAALYAASRCCFEAEVLNGPGKKTYPNGSVHEGEFKDGKLHGQGKITYRDGFDAEGKFMDTGKISFSNVRGIEEGEFKDGKLNGQGKHTDPDGIVSEGEFKDGFLCQGKRTLPIFADGKGGTVFEGQFTDGRYLHGKGKKVFLHNETIEEGIFDFGRLIQGTIKKSDGQVAEGKFEDGKLYGIGRKTLSDGTVEEGWFTGDILSGGGKITYPDGKIEKR